MFEDPNPDSVAHYSTNGSISANVVESVSLTAPESMSPHIQARLREIDQLINDLELATQSTNANVTILRGELAVCRQQLEAKSAQLEELQEEGARQQQLLQSAQAELAAVSASKASLEKEYNSSQQQLEAKSAQLEELQEEGARQQQLLQSAQAELAAVSASKASLEKEYKEEKENAESLLHQLHLVQEELETIFIEKCQKDTELAETTKKLTRSRQKCVKPENSERLINQEAAHLRRQLNRQAEKLDWLRGQRQLLMRMVLAQSRKLREMMALNARVCFAVQRSRKMNFLRRITLR